MAWSDGLILDGSTLLKLSTSPARRYREYLFTINLSAWPKMPSQANKRGTQFDLLPLAGARPQLTTRRTPGESQIERTTKRKDFSTSKKPSRKAIEGRDKDLVLCDIVEAGKRPYNSLVVRRESPWETYRKIYDCKLAGPITVVVHHVRPRKVIALRTFSKDIHQILEKVQHLRHENVVSALECF